MAQESNPVAFREVSGVAVNAWGTATAPGAGVAVATIASGSLPVGLYRVDVSLSYNAGTLTATEDGNWNLRRQTTVVARLAAPRALNVQFRHYGIYVRLSGSESLNLAANAAGSTGVVYVATLIATPVGP
jgi:hypothetical protein